MKQKVVAVGGILHESNSFNPTTTRLDDFTLREQDWDTGNTEIAGFLEELTGANVQIAHLIYAEADPRGPVDREAFEYLCGRLLSRIESTTALSGVLLALHGAMYTDEFPHADVEIVRRVRHSVGADLPLIVTHDFHANIAPEIVAMTDALLTYQQNPHLDTKQRGMRAARILIRMLRDGLRPRQAIAKPPMLWNIAFQNTFDEPFFSITAASRELEDQTGILAASVAGGYQYNDVRYIGPSVVVVAEGDQTRAQLEAEHISDMMWNRRNCLRLDLPDAEQAVREAMRAKRFPVVLLDAGDNVGGGGTGDETALLEQLVLQNARGWVAVLFDPAAVESAKASGIGGCFDESVGGRCPGARTQPVRVRGTVRSLHRGRYVETEIRHGGRRYWDMGHSAVLEISTSKPDELNLLVLTARRSSPNSLHALISCGIYPDRQRILVAKGVIAPRAAYQQVAAELILVDTPGLTAVNPARFAFQRVRANVWGLDSSPS